MSKREEFIAEANKVIATLFSKYRINHPSKVKQIVRDEFTQAEVDAYRAAISVLQGNDAI